MSWGGLLGGALAIGVTVSLLNCFYCNAPIKSGRVCNSCRARRNATGGIL